MENQPRVGAVEPLLKHKKLQYRYLVAFSYIVIYRVDEDNDKVSDSKDACPSVPGLWAFKGCPDSDVAGFEDMQDNCPLEAGTAEFRGCPDIDGNNIIANEDIVPAYP